MNDWLQYERKRAAFERRWQKAIAKALKAQTLYYVNEYTAGRISGAMPDLSFFGLLQSLYGNVGAHFAGTTNRELRREARGSGHNNFRGRDGNSNVQGRRMGAKASNTAGDGKPAQISIKQDGVLEQEGQGSLPGQKALVEKGISLKADPITRGSLGFSIDWAQRVAARLRDAALSLAQKISERTRQIVLSILEEAQTENLTLEETIQRIMERAGELNRGRAESIARTEVGRAATEGKMQGAKALGVELEKVWVSARDHRTRHNPAKDPKKGDHWVLNGQRRPLDEPFSNGVHQLMQPGDKSAPASETIRCRCTVVFEVKTDPQGRAVERSYLTL